MAYGSECFYSYDEENMLGGKVCIAEYLFAGEIRAKFYIKSEAMYPINLAKARFRVQKIDDSIYILGKPEIIYNSGISDSLILNPKLRIHFSCKVPFHSREDIKDIKEVYIKIRDKIIFFVPEDKVGEYSKKSNRELRHIRNPW